MKDVAREAGVGIKTVSRVVNGEGYVGEATAARVEQPSNDSPTGATSAPDPCAVRIAAP